MSLVGVDAFATIHDPHELHVWNKAPLHQLYAHIVAIMYCELIARDS